MLMSLFLQGAWLANKYADAIQKDTNGQAIQVKCLEDIACESNRLSLLAPLPYRLITVYIELVYKA